MGALRIAIVAASARILGGQGVQASLLAQALRQDGHLVAFVPIDATFPRGARWLRRIRFLRTVVNQLFYVPSLVALARVDVVQVFSASYWSFLLAPLPAMIAGRLLGKRVVLHYHSGEAADHLARWGVLVHPWLKLPHEIVVPSDYLARTFAAHGYRVRVVPNIVDLRTFRYRERRPLAPRLLSIRNLEPYYRIDVTLRAFAKVKDAAPDATLTVAGYGSEERALRELAGDLHVEDAIRFAGRVEPEDVPALFDGHDIFVNASLVDNQPVSVLEAFAAGTPVVTTAVGDIPAMAADGEMGHLVPPNDPEALARGVCRLLRNPEAAILMARRAHESIERYTWPSVRRAWRGAYEGHGSATASEAVPAA